MISGGFSMAWRKSWWAKAIFSSSAFLFGSARKKRAYRPRLEMLEDRNLLSTFTVDHLADDMVGSGLNGSLRYAITNAVDNDTIMFGVTGTINLTGALPGLAHSISIEGPGADQLTVRRDIGGYYRIFTVGFGSMVSIDGLTISNGEVYGDYGGGIYNGGTLTVSNSTLSGNTSDYGGGIFNHGTLTVTGSTLSGNFASGYDFDNGGGGIYNYEGMLTVSNSTLSGNSATDGGGGIYNSYGTLTVSNSTLSGNSADHGGGISNYAGMLTVSNSTLSGNSASEGGGISNYYGTLTVSNSTLSGNSAPNGRGGGISNYSGTLTVSNSTLSGNSAAGVNDGGGGIYNFGTLTVSNSTLSGNSTAGVFCKGGGINSSGPATLTNVTVTSNRATSSVGGGLYVYAGAPVLLHNTLIAGNFRGATGTTRDDVHGALNLSGDYNLIGDGTGMTGLSNGVNGDLVGSAAAPIDPLLGPLQDNGGPTQTMALRAGSPALNAGNPSQLGTPDQRGVVRAGGVNIGAYQASASAFVLTVPASVAAGTPFDGTVQAVDDFGQVAFGYTGTVTFRVTDTDPAVVLPLDYTFTADDAGTHTFTGGFILITPGDQTLTVADLANGLSMDVTLTVTP
jgi:hypothetical protein